MQIREIVKNDSENYITEEELAKQVQITLESIPLIAAKLIMIPDNSNIAIKFYTTRYEKLMCGYCFQNEDKFMFSKEVVSITKKYLNQPKIFKLLIEQAASQTDIRLENELKKELEKSEEPEVKTEEVPEDSQESKIQPNENNKNTNNKMQTSYENDKEKQTSYENDKEKQTFDVNNNEKHTSDENDIEYEDEEFEEKTVKNKSSTEKRMIYFNAPEIEYDDKLSDSNEIELLSEEETQKYPPYSIKLPTQIRPTIIALLGRFFKHNKTVYSSIFYQFNSTSLSIESIHNIDQVLSQILTQPKNKNNEISN